MLLGECVARREDGGSDRRVGADRVDGGAGSSLLSAGRSAAAGGGLLGSTAGL